MRIETILGPIVATLIFGGCAVTQQGAIQELAPIYQKQFEAAARSRAETVKEVMAALKEIKRGGMDLELDEDGRVKAIHYREHLDEEMLRRALNTVKPNMPVPHAPAQDYAALFMGIGSVVTPFTALYFGHKNHKIDADVRMHESETQSKNWDMFTGRFKSESTETVAWPPEYLLDDNGSE